MTHGSTTATFLYNHDGIRVRKIVNGVTTNIYVHGDVSRRAQWAKQAGEVPVSHRVQHAGA